MSFVLSKIFEDPTPNGVVTNRIVRALFEMSDATTLTADERQRFFRALLLLGRKLCATWRHLQAFQRVQLQLVANAQAHPPTDRQLDVDTAQDLFIEFDEFLVQLKSSLDYLVKVPTTIVGNRIWSLSTFGDSGDKVAKALARNLPTRYRVHARGLQELVLDKHRPWLKWAIGLRDELNHLLSGDFAFESFAVGWTVKQGVWQIHVPQVDDQTTALSALQSLWHKLLELVEDFVVGFLAMRLQAGFTFFHGAATPGDAHSPWSVSNQEAMDEALRRSRS